MRVALLLLLVLPITTFAQDCDGDSAERVRKAYAQLPADTRAQHDNLQIDAERAACRIWPADPSLTLMAIPVMGEWEEDGSVRNGDLQLLVVDTATLRTRASLHLPDAMSSDAIRTEAVSLDTARYRLSADVRAFGVRIDRSGSSRPNPFSDTRLQLFVLDKTVITPVTGQIVVEASGGEWDTRCAGEFQETHRTIEVDVPPAQGFATLRVRERSTDILNREDTRGECQEQRRELPVRTYRLQPQGREYPLPKAIEAQF